MASAKQKRRTARIKDLQARGATISKSLGGPGRVGGHVPERKVGNSGGHGGRK